MDWVQGKGTSSGSLHLLGHQRPMLHVPLAGQVGAGGLQKLAVQSPHHRLNCKNGFSITSKMRVCTPVLCVLLQGQGTKALSNLAQQLPCTQAVWRAPLS